MRKHLITAFAIPFFFAIFIIAYNPFYLADLVDYGVYPPAVHMILLSCTLMVTLVISRLIYHFVEKANGRLKWWQDMIWCISEVFAASFFVALYMSLFSHVLYFECLAYAIGIMYAVLIFPYSILCLTEALVYRVEEGKTEKDPQNIIHFYDENKKLKLVIAASSVLFIKADDNSVRIHYIDAGKLKVFPLRTSMRSLEDLALKYHLVRCQRSYYVNPSHVKILRKDSDGFIFADLSIEGIESIPVSKTYYDNLSSIL